MESAATSLQHESKAKPHTQSLGKQRSRYESESCYPMNSPWENVTSIIPTFRSSPSSSSSASSSSSSSSKESNNSSSVLTLPPTATQWSAYIPQDPMIVAILSGVGCTALTIGGLMGYRRFWRRIRNSDYVTSGMLDRKIWVKGRVTR